MDDESRTRPSLIERMKSREEYAWEEFVKIYQPRLVLWAQRYGLSTDDAEDAVGEVLTNLVQHMGEFNYDPSGSFRGYLRTMVRNMVASSKKRRSKLKPFLLIETDNDIPSPDAFDSLLDEMCKLETDALRIVAIKQTLDSLDPKERTIWMALHLKLASPDEVAAEYNVSPATAYRIKNRISDSMKKTWERWSSGEDPT